MYKILCGIVRSKVRELWLSAQRLRFFDGKKRGVADRAVGNAKPVHVSGLGISGVDAGNYVLICFIPSPDGTPHFAKGMVRPLTVAASTDAVAAEPTSDVTLSLKDYSFTLSKPLTSGKHTIRIESSGSQSHEMQLVRLAPGQKAQDVPAWVAKPTKHPERSPFAAAVTMNIG